jgi:hypothetical protein
LDEMDNVIISILQRQRQGKGKEGRRKRCRPLIWWRCWAP